jgi:ribonucleoside-diphosphate reductase alpha chain
VHLAVRFLDDVVEVNRYPTAQTDRAARATRKVGLGMMGFAEALAALGVSYASSDAPLIAGRLARHIGREARLASVELAAERGPFPAFDESTFARKGSPPLRNAQLTSVAPTGTISLLAGTTSGIEPMFAVAYERTVLGRPLIDVNPLFAQLAHEGGFWSDDLIADIARTGSVQGRKDVPARLQPLFVTALELEPEQHLAVQAAVQRHVDAAVSKTVNLPAEATVDDVRRIYLAAHDRGVKGITVYRDGSHPDQVLHLLPPTTPQAGGKVSVGQTYSGGCAARVCTF